MPFLQMSRVLFTAVSDTTDHEHIEVHWGTKYSTMGVMKHRTAPTCASHALCRNTCLGFNFISRKRWIRPIRWTDEGAKRPVTRRSRLLVVRCTRCERCTRSRCGVSSHRSTMHYIAVSVSLPLLGPEITVSASVMPSLISAVTVCLSSSLACSASAMLQKCLDYIAAQNKHKLCMDIDVRYCPPPCQKWGSGHSVPWDQRPQLYWHRTSTSAIANRPFSYSNAVKKGITTFISNNVEQW